MALHIFGVRHHGPGCARALRRALQDLQPDAVLVEGPPDGSSVLSLLRQPHMVPPVALLIYPPDRPQRAVYFPFAQFSPEWQALQFAFENQITPRFMDLPQAIQLADEPGEEGERVENGPEELPEQGDTPSQGRQADGVDRAPDPLAMLAQAAGYSDHEIWWEREIEQRHDAAGLFQGILEAMTALRHDLAPQDDHEAAREAYMRQTIRAALQEGYQQIAVVCGAWHTPALLNLENDAADAKLLRGRRQVRVEATWIPWTYSRLAYRSGYGAGITSPGWYTHLWEATEQTTIRWVAHAAQLLREQGLDASSAGVIEAVRLSEALAAMGDLPMPGLGELHEAIQAVLCNGSAEPMQLIRDKLEIGEAMGEVPTETPMVPLQRDLEAEIRHLKLKQSPEASNLALDLRNQTDRSRSQLLHRLRLLEIRWGEPQRISHSVRGTFHENWQLRWRVEFVVDLVLHNIWGNTVADAATNYARNRADSAEALPAVTALLESVILAGLDDATDYLLARLESLAAIAADVRHLMDALPPLGQVIRYGDVRGTAPRQIEPVMKTLFARMLIGLPGACVSLDDDAAQAMVVSIDHVQETIDTLRRDDMREEWLDVLGRLVDRDTADSRIRGRCCRLLLEQHRLDEAAVARLAQLALSPVTAADQAMSWIDGMLHGSGLRLLQQNGLWRALDVWLVALSPEAFVGMLPLLRRAFAAFQAPERRAMGEKVLQLHWSQPTRAGSTTTQSDLSFQALIDQKRAGLVIPVLDKILGAGQRGDA